MCRSMVGCDSRTMLCYAMLYGVYDMPCYGTWGLYPRRRHPDAVSLLLPARLPSAGGTPLQPQEDGAPLTPD